MEGGVCEGIGWKDWRRERGNQARYDEHEAVDGTGGVKGCCLVSKALHHIE